MRAKKKSYWKQGRSILWFPYIKTKNSFNFFFIFKVYSIALDFGEKKI